MSERIEAFGNNCTLVAVKSVLNGTKTDEEILMAFRDEGYVDNRGMTHLKWTTAAKRLGLELETVRLPKREFYYKNHTNYWGERFKIYVQKRYTLREFCKDNPEGVFFISTRNHALVIVDGCIWDPNCVGSSMARGVEAAKRVLNSPLKRVTTGKIQRLNMGQTITKSWYRRESAIVTGKQ